MDNTELFAWGTASVAAAEAASHVPRACAVLDGVAAAADSIDLAVAVVAANVENAFAASGPVPGAWQSALGCGQHVAGCHNKERTGVALTASAAFAVHFQIQDGLAVAFAGISAQVVVPQQVSETAIVEVHYRQHSPSLEAATECAETHCSLGFLSFG